MAENFGEDACKTIIAATEGDNLIGAARELRDRIRKLHAQLFDFESRLHNRQNPPHPDSETATAEPGTFEGALTNYLQDSTEEISRLEEIALSLNRFV